jgi:serine/threonine protein phosphatase 1
MKQWVIPDIHGCVNTLRTLIANQIKPDKSDLIYFLGDYIDRGPDSKGVIDYLISMKKLGHNFRFLMGNHENCFLKAFANKSQSKGIFKKKNSHKKAWFKHYGEDTVKSFGIENLNDIPQYYIHWMQELEYYIETENFIFVHAGLNFKNDNPFEDKHAMLWVRDYEIVPEKINGKRIIHGHVPMSLEFIILNIRNRAYPFIDLDNGVYMKDVEGFGNLVALELQSLKLLVQPNLD